MSVTSPPPQFYSPGEREGSDEGVGATQSCPALGGPTRRGCWEERARLPSGLTTLPVSRRLRSTTSRTRRWPSSGCWSWASSRTSPTSDGAGAAQGHVPVSPTLQPPSGGPGGAGGRGGGQSIVTTAPDTGSRVQGAGAALARGSPGAQGAPWLFPPQHSQGGDAGTRGAPLPVTFLMETLKITRT